MICGLGLLIDFGSVVVQRLVYLDRVVRLASKKECPQALFLHDFEATATLWSHFGQFFTIARLLLTIIPGFL